MLRSNSDTTTSASSPTAVSPFSSNYSVPSEPTSDEVPDLGQFNAVIRAWNYLQPPFPRLLNPSFARQHEPTSSSRHDFLPTLSSEIESGGQGQPRSTVWAHGPIASYLAPGDFTADTETDRERDNNNHTSLTTTSSIPTRALFPIPIPQRTPRSDDDRDADVEDEEYSHSDSRGDHPRSVQIEDLTDLDSSFGHDIYDDNESNDMQPVEPGSLDLSQLHLNEGHHPKGLGDLTLQDVEDQPSLGYLDEALRFIAAERLRFNAQREAGLNATSPSASESRRKRRRKRKTPRAQSVARTSTTSTTHGLIVPSATASASTPSLLSTLYSANPGDDGEDADEDNSSSSYDQHYSSSSQQQQIRQPLFKSTPGTPGSKRRGTQLKKQTAQRKLKHASSTPMLRPPSRALDVDEPINPRLGLLRSLGKKLEKIFPEDKSFLATVTYGILPPLGIPNGSYFDAAAAESSTNTGVLGNFIDTRGVTKVAKFSGESARIIHVFVDHSNILIGLLNYLKKHPRQHPQYSQQSSGGDNGQGSLSSPVNIYPKPPKHLSHSALALILERGRPVTRRELVTSSPLYQPMSSAELLGYDVKIFARVPDLGDGADKDRQRPGVGHSRSNSHGSFPNGNMHSNSGSGSGGGGGVEVSTSPRKGRRRAGSVNAGASPSAGPPAASHNRNRGHRRGFSHGNTSTESEQGVSSASGPQHSSFARSGGIPFGSPALASLLSSTPPTITPGGTIRVRYREQGVDELLQLKLHQALASIDGPPPKGSTIVLATGDGNAGQYNEDGFLGTVRLALKRGWKVELYAWEGGLSKSWKREFGETSEWGARANGSDGAKFKIIGMEQFGSELVEIYF